MRIYFGTFTRQSTSRGIYTAELNPESGAVSTPVLAGETENPSFLALHPSGDFLFSVCEFTSENGIKYGGVKSFKIHKDGTLSEINRQPFGMRGPCYVSTAQNGSVLLAADYQAGSIASYPVSEKAEINPALSVVQHSGNSLHPKRQNAPHAHSIYQAPDGFILACDLGIDRIKIYRLSGQGSLDAHSEVLIEPGSGPRHLAFHPAKGYIYLINELNSTITVFSYQKGGLKEIQTISALPADFSGPNTSAEIAVHPSGNFIYVSNRGHESIAVYKVNAEDGTLCLSGFIPCQVKTPRHFALSPCGNFLIAAGMDSNTAAVFRVNNGIPIFLNCVEIPSPVCVLFSKK
ncbi:MAG: hypothetical protein A2096_09900 [Spirochaetes bacterium GWF1_41_5]|nr:MAG: hypothetical protein A2096_09900 [Spirochaetes bacterium GWF1_41_5]